MTGDGKPENVQEHHMLINYRLDFIDKKLAEMSNKLDSKFDRIDTDIDRTNARVGDLEKNHEVLKVKSGVIGALSGSIPTLLSAFYTYWSNRK